MKRSHKKELAVVLLIFTAMIGAAAGLLAGAHGSGRQPVPAVAAQPQQASAPPAGRPAFKHRGFYLHCGWAFDRPFAPRSWTRDDYDGMFKLLKLLGFDTVMYWPQVEAIPAPISEADAAVLRAVREIIGDARKAGLACWLTLTPNLISPPELAAKPFKDRNPYKSYQTVRFDDPKQAEAFLSHRTAMLRIVNNADAYVTIDGDPGGYAGAKPDDWLRVFLSDRAAIDANGADPRHQSIIPWIWAGWGAKVPPWQEDPTPFSRAAMALLKQRLPEPWLMMPGRSHKEGWANGRVNVALAEELGLVDRSMILCYEAVEFEPTPPAAFLQFDHIRRILREELHLAPRAYGVMANAQQPVMTLPNIYLFARGAWDLSYLDRSDAEVLGDLAAFLGGPADRLVPAWRCLTLGLDQLPRDLPEKLRRAALTGEAAWCLPGGPRRYLEILAAQVASRIGLLEAIDRPAKNDGECAERLASGTAALIGWWNVHHFVMDGDPAQGFAWNFVRHDQVAPLAEWAVGNARDRNEVAKAAARRLAKNNVTSERSGLDIVNALFTQAR